MRRYKERQEEEQNDGITHCEFEDEILSKVKDNKTNERQFLEEVRLVDDEGEESLGYAFYTYRGHLYILDNQGMDCAFLCYEERTRKRIHKIIMNGEFRN
jgi:hypothetical protein